MEREQPQGCTEEELEEIPEITLTNQDSEYLAKECAVCQDCLKEEEEVLVLKCSHIFHKTCVLPWLKTVLKN
jgi:E3 ubiquitin-protein ligase RNF115/126